MAENFVETETCEYLESLGWTTRKIRYIGRDGCPDRLVYGYGFIFLIEFKDRGKELRPLQAKEHTRFRQQGIPVFMIDNLRDGKRLAREMTDRHA